MIWSVGCRKWKKITSCRHSTLFNMRHTTKLTQAPTFPASSGLDNSWTNFSSHCQNHKWARSKTCIGLLSGSFQCMIWIHHKLQPASTSRPCDGINFRSKCDILQRMSRNISKTTPSLAFWTEHIGMLLHQLHAADSEHKRETKQKWFSNVNHDKGQCSLLAAMRMPPS